MKKILLILFSFSFLLSSDINCSKMEQNYKIVIEKNEKIILENEKLKEKINNLNLQIKSLKSENKKLKNEIAKLNESIWDKINFKLIFEILFGIWLILFIFFYFRKKFNW
jgi:peptidoglycan hydrolase CwlO-like protein